MTGDILTVEEEKGILLLTLNRPEVMNSLNFALLHAIGEQIEAVRHRSDVRVVVITGAGEKAFCAGADLKERATLPPEKVKEFIYTIRDLFTRIELLSKPVIAAVNGIALGGGTELALACDIRIASATAAMGLTETRLAIIPGGRRDPAAAPADRQGQGQGTDIHRPPGESRRGAVHRPGEPGVRAGRSGR